MEQYFWWGFFLIFTVNTIAAIFTVFREKRSIASIWAWLLVLILFPIGGFIIYYFIGRRISHDDIFHLQAQDAMGMTTLVDRHLDENGHHKSLKNYKPAIQELISLLFRSDYSILTNHNEVEIITSGEEKMVRLLDDIQQAKYSIHMQYYIYNRDIVGDEIMNAIIERAEAGIEVRFLYDAIGSRLLKEKQLKDLKAAGGEASSFFGRRRNSLVNFRLNFRNHRKIVVIDGEIGYVGGFNIAKEYVGLGPLGYWRDTHLRIRGNAVQALQSQFFIDWFATKHERSRELPAKYFRAANDLGNVPVQIVSSGPDQDINQIKWGYLKMISLANKQINIQTPYFIPDESVYEAIEIAVLSGIEVNIMIPCKPDHPFVYRATEYYCREIQKSGVNIYRYDNGFMHSKTVTVDGEIASVGTANFDIRSFNLNFEINAFIYDAKMTKELEDIYLKDIQQSTLLDEDYFNNQSAWKKFRQNFSRLLSPIL